LKEASNSQELDPLLKRNASGNAMRNGSIIPEPTKVDPSDSMALKTTSFTIGDNSSNTNLDNSIETSIEKGRTCNLASNNDSLKVQHQTSTKSNRSNNNDTPGSASKDLSFFLQQQKDTSQRALISPQIRFVMFQFLFTTVRPFTSEFLTKNVLELIFKKALFKESKRLDHKQPPEYLYRYTIIFNHSSIIYSF
jgi:hypothetical protein